MAKTGGKGPLEHKPMEPREATKNAVVREAVTHGEDQLGSAHGDPKIIRSSRENAFPVETLDTHNAKKHLIQPVVHVIGPDAIPPEERLPSAREVQTQSHELTSPALPHKVTRVVASKPVEPPTEQKFNQPPHEEPNQELNRYPVDSVELTHQEAVKQPVIWNVTPSKDRVHEAPKESVHPTTIPVSNEHPTSSFGNVPVRKIYVSSGDHSARVQLTPEGAKDQIPTTNSSHEIRVSNPIVSTPVDTHVVTNSGPFEAKREQHEFSERVCGVKETSWGNSGATPEDLAYLQQNAHAPQVEQLASAHEHTEDHVQHVHQAQAPLPVPKVFPVQGEKHEGAQD